MLEITPERFYKIGMYSFIGIAVFNLLTLLQGYKFMFTTSIISSGISIFFNFIVAGFFLYLLNNTLMPVMEEGESTDDLQKIVRGIKIKK